MFSGHPENKFLSIPRLRSEMIMSHSYCRLVWLWRLSCEKSHIIEQGQFETLHSVLLYILQQWVARGGKVFYASAGFADIKHPYIVQETKTSQSGALDWLPSLNLDDPRAMDMLNCLLEDPNSAWYARASVHGFANPWRHLRSNALCLLVT